MDQNLRSLLMAWAMRSCANRNPAIWNLLSQAGFSDDATSQLDLQAEIAKLNESNPALAMLLQRLAGSGAKAPEEEADVTDNETQEGERIETGRVQEYQQKFEGMRAELRWLREKNDEVTAALGACYLCWGENSQCEICGGAGGPGAFEPDQEKFSRLVTPALRRIRRSSLKGNQANPAIQDPDGT